MENYNFICGIFNAFYFKMKTFKRIQILFFSFALCGLSAVGFAQNEFLNQNNSIAPKGSSMTTPKTFKPSVFSPNTKPKNNTSSSILEDKKLQFTKNNQFANPGDTYKEKLNNNLQEGGQDNKIFRKNEYFGEFKTKGDHIKIMYRDFGGVVDGDLIRLLVNNKIMISEIMLEGEYKSFILGLEKGFNKIDYEAITEGTFVPNTAEFQIYDDQDKLITIGQWYLATGFKASIMIIRED
jgi:hypothetical protein